MTFKKKGKCLHFWFTLEMFCEKSNLSILSFGIFPVEAQLLTTDLVFFVNNYLCLVRPSTLDNGVTVLVAAKNKYTCVQREDSTRDISLDGPELEWR